MHPSGKEGCLLCLMNTCHPFHWAAVGYSTNTHAKACVTRRNNACLLKELTLITLYHTVRERERKGGRKTLLFIFGGEPNVSINNVQAQVSVPNTERR